MRSYERLNAIPRKLDARGNLILLAPYRWDPKLLGLKHHELRGVAEGRSQADWQSYQAWAARDELDRRAPKTASWCTDVEKGWQPVVA
jgi:hypothetical protein